MTFLVHTGAILRSVFFQRLFATASIRQRTNKYVGSTRRMT